jgi:ferredoxin-NADP reductase
VLLEIEELAKGIRNCTVQESGCLGACGQAPNAEVVRGRKRLVCTRISDVEKSAAVIQQATGSMPSLEDPELVRRLGDARTMRVRNQARAEAKWNVALAGFSEHVMSKSGTERLELQFELSQLMASAGLWEEALVHVTEAESMAGGNIMLLMERAKLLGKLGRSEDLDAVQQRVSAMSLDFRLVIEVTSLMRRCKSECDAVAKLDAPQRPIEKYGLWLLEGITKMTKHSAVYHFTSKDKARGTPNPRGRGRTVWHKTWHTTLLADVGTNSEGPLPWIERDYTPISTSKEWEQGKCDILIKIYDTGLATSWLHRQEIGRSLRLSQPMKTLDVPSLVPDLTQATFRPASVLLLLAGTGIVAVPQVLHHADHATCFGSNVVMTQPVSLVFSCRSDDVLLLEQLKGWCISGKLKRCTLLLTEPQAGSSPPFPEVGEADLAQLADVENMQCIRARLSRELLESELGRLQSPTRLVVSGPAPFNAAAKRMLSEGGVPADAITILNA